MRLRRLLGLCEHRQVRFHSFKTYMPDTTYAVGNCTNCGNRREVKIGFVAHHTQERLIEVANTVLAQKGWVLANDGTNTWTREV